MSALGSTGYQPVPSGNLPDGTGVAPLNNPGIASVATFTAIPVGKLPVPPIFQTRHGFAGTGQAHQIQQLFFDLCQCVLSLDASKGE